MQKVNPQLSLINHAETISVYVTEHSDEVTSSGVKRKRTLGPTDATHLLDEGTYETTNDFSTRDFQFYVQFVEIHEGQREVENVFDVLRLAQTHDIIELPPPRNTRNNTVDDFLHTDIRIWLERKGVGWSRAEVTKTKGKDFLNNITAAFSPLTSTTFDAMSDKHNAGRLTLVNL